MQINPQSTGEATYCPEDNKLRLYTGRVPREEFLALRSEGWKAMPKQREMGGGDFVATWTPERYQTALAYGGGVVLDEDMGPQERAADRAERFSGYRDRRLDEATGHADRYDAQPAAHGYQSQAKAERAAARHDRIGDRAVDAWDKAEYWQSRTAGVISHALYKSEPGVRMGRINELESQIRKYDKARAEASATFNLWKKCSEMPDGEKKTTLVLKLAYVEHGDYIHPRTGRKSYLFDHARFDEGRTTDVLTASEICELWLSQHHTPSDKPGAWETHFRMRLAYERQMLEAQGGRLEQVEVQPGGKLGNYLILKVNKSAASGRVKSVSVLAPRRERGWGVRNFPGTDWSEEQIDLERLSVSSYTAPTDESLKELEEVRAKIKAGKPDIKAPPLINPTDEDAERLQKIWNDRAREAYEKHIRESYHSEKIVADSLAKFKPSTVRRIPQDVYSENSKGAYAKAEASEIQAGARIYKDRWMSSGERRQKYGPTVCKVRTTHGDGSTTNASQSVIILTDKPQKPLPAAVWAPYVAPVLHRAINAEVPVA